MSWSWESVIFPTFFVRRFWDMVRTWKVMTSESVVSLFTFVLGSRVQVEKFFTLLDNGQTIHTGKCSFIVLPEMTTTGRFPDCSDPCTGFKFTQ